MSQAADPVRIVEEWVEQGVVRGASLLVGQRGAVVLRRHFGLAQFLQRSAPVTDATVFMIASITKTLTAACFMRYVERGAIALAESPARFLPEFAANGKERITFLHLLTHTSGLPEQVEGKDDLRRREAGMEEFLARICAATPLFEPGCGRQYSNCGFAVLACAVEAIEGRRFGEVLGENVLKPLRMDDSALGFEASWDARVADLELPPGAEEERAFVNTRYWRGLGAPWGAMISTTDDLFRFAEAMRNGGRLGAVRVLSEASAAAMVRDWRAAMPSLPPEAHPAPLGLAWALRGTGEGRFFGDLASPGSFGHTGATGTFLWVDPARALTAVFLSNREQGNDPVRFARLSNAIVASCT